MSLCPFIPVTFPVYVLEVPHRQTGDLPLDCVSSAPDARSTEAVLSLEHGQELTCQSFLSPLTFTVVRWVDACFEGP